MVAFGPQIPMGRSYERGEIFGVDEAPATRAHTGLVVKNPVGNRVKGGSRFSLNEIQFPSWTAVNARVIATFEDNSPAVTINRYGKGMAITIMPDASTAAQNIPELARDVVDYAVLSGGSSLPVDIVGSNEKTDVAIEQTRNGFRIVVINHNSGEMEVILRPVKSGTERVSEWVDLVSDQKMLTASADFSLKLKIKGSGFRALEFRRTSAD